MWPALSAASASTATSRYSTFGVAASSACSWATRNGLDARSMPSTRAPRRAIASDRMPPPQPTSSTRLPREPGGGIDPVEPKRVDPVQRPEFALGVPPAMRQFAELGELLRVGIDHRTILTTASKREHTCAVDSANCLRISAPKQKTPPKRGFRCGRYSISGRGYRPLRFPRGDSWRGLRRSCCRQPAASRPCLRCRRGSSRRPCSPGTT